MDFVFDRTAEGRVIKNLTVVDDATHEAVAIVPERAIGGLSLTRMLDHLALQRGLPSSIRTDNARVVIEAWRREYNEERPKKGLGGLTPSAYAEQLALKHDTVTSDSKLGCY